jgi:hypothetical protein
MSTVSSVSNPYVISHPVTDANPGQTALNKGIERNNYQHSLVNVSKSGGASSKSKMKKNKKMRKSKRMSKMSSRRRFSRKFRKSLRQSSRKSMLRRRNKNKNKMFSRGGAAAATMTIPSFSQTTPNGTSIINQLSVAHSQGLAYSAFDGDVKLPAASAAPSASVSK